MQKKKRGDARKGDYRGQRSVGLFIMKIETNDELGGEIMNEDEETIREKELDDHGQYKMKSHEGDWWERWTLNESRSRVLLLALLPTLFLSLHHCRVVVMGKQQI